MTLKDLIETCPQITALEIEIRDNGAFVHRYRIGYGAEYTKYELEGNGYLLKKHPTDVDPAPINIWDEDRTGPWGVKLKAIPKQLLDLRVSHWRPAWLFRKRDDNEIKLFITLDPEGKSLPEPKKSKKAAPAAGDPYQMSIEDVYRDAFGWA
jgi:hypothetical protein